MKSCILVLSLLLCIESSLISTRGDGMYKMYGWCGFMVVSCPYLYTALPRSHGAYLIHVIKLYVDNRHIHYKLQNTTFV
jgi:hypothetical protein